MFHLEGRSRFRTEVAVTTGVTSAVKVGSLLVRKPPLVVATCPVKESNGGVILMSVGVDGDDEGFAEDLEEEVIVNAGNRDGF